MAVRPENDYLMQFQSNIADASYWFRFRGTFRYWIGLCGRIAACVWDESIFGKLNRVSYKPDMEVENVSRSM